MFGKGSLREKKYPTPLFHGLQSVTEVKKFQLGGMTQFNSSVRQPMNRWLVRLLIVFSHTRMFDHVGTAFLCLLLSFNDVYHYGTSKKTDSESMNQNLKPYKFDGFVGDVSWISRYRNQNEFIIFPLETLRVYASDEEPSGTIRFHVVAGGTRGQLSKSLEQLCAKLCVNSKPRENIVPITITPEAPFQIEVSELETMKRSLKSISENNYIASNETNATLFVSVKLKSIPKEEPKAPPDNVNALNILLKPLKPKRTTTLCSTNEHEEPFSNQ